MADSQYPSLLNTTGRKVELLQEALVSLGYEVPTVELTGRRYGPGTAALVRELAARRAEWQSGLLEEPADLALKEAIVATADSATVTGRLVFEHGLPAAGIVVRAYSRGFGGKKTLLAEGTTDADGAYALGYQRPDGPVSLEVRTLDHSRREVSLSEPKVGAGVDETLNLVAPESVRPLAPEYERLTASVEHALGASKRIRNAREGAGQRDLSIVAQATGWDARLLALAATAEKMSVETKVPADALYALFRTGLPTNRDELFRVHPKLVDQAWRTAAAAGVVKGGNGIAEARGSFRMYARAAFRDAKAPGALSSNGELLAAARLPEKEQAAWEDACLSGATGPQLWTAARKKGVLAKSIEKLQLQGRLAQLTLNNGPLAADLHRTVAGDDGMTALVDEGLYQPDAWKERLSTLVTNETHLRELIPPAYAGERTEDRLDAYASDMARKVRLAFPTHVVGHMLEAGDLPLERGKSVGALLRKAAAEGFELGRTPVDAFFRAKRKTLLSSDADGTADASLEAVKRIYRLCQITPGNDAMKTLLRGGFDSAQDVVVVDRDTFMSRHGDTLGADAALVYDKAVQVASTSQAVVASARVLDYPPIRALSGSQERHRDMVEAAKKALVKHYPTMEQLFGSLDFCECEQCRSVLGPAAYLVDLLRFIDPKSPGWDHFVTDWNASHTSKFGPGGEYDKPYDQLASERGSHIPNIPLTCANTNTLLPYIDLVNEILEYYVADEGFPGHDTGDATTEQLVAEPQYVLPQAYTALEGAHYPVGLPFDLWLETVRAYLARLDVPLWQLLETFRATDELFRPPQDTTTPYFRSQVFAESLGLSPAEWALFTRGATGSWWDLYGYPSSVEAENELASAKTLARRLGVSYRELTELVQTWFVNPGLSELVLLSKVGIGLGEVYAFYNHEMTDPEQAAFVKALNDFGERAHFDAKKWLDERYADGTLSRALVLAAPTVECNFDETRFVYADGTSAAAVDFVKLNLFVRLWRKLGWTIDELDHALTALVPPYEQPLKSQFLGRALGAVLIYLAHLNTLASELQIGTGGRVKLAALWADISTRGKNSLYAQLFLTPAVLRDYPEFDEPTGKYLPPGGYLAVYRAPVQAALTLAASELERIAADAGLTLASTPLSIHTLSKLYRYRLLADALDISIDDLVTLKSLSALDPFFVSKLKLKPLAVVRPGWPGGQPSPLADDLPFTQTIRFVEVAGLVAASGFSIEELDYLLRHRLDPVGPFQSDPQVLLELVVQLGAGITQIRAENAPPDDPAALDDETLRQKLALILPADSIETFMAMWRGTMQYQAVRENIAPANAVDPDREPFDPAKKPFAFEVAVAYDAARQRQRLSVTGVLIQKRTRELAPNPGLLRSLLDDVQGQARSFASDHLAGLFPETRNGDFTNVEDVFEPVPSTPSEARAVLARKRQRIVERLFPLLHRRLTAQLIVASQASTLAADPRLVEALLTDPALLADPRWPSASLLDGFAAAADAGATANFYPSTDGSGAATSTKLVAEVDTTKKPQTGSAHSARLEGVLQPATSGSHTFFVHVDDPGTRVELRFSHLPDPVVAATAAAANFEPSAAIDLRAGVPYEFRLNVHNLAAGDVTVLVAAESLPKGAVSRLRLHPAASIERVRRADVLLAKALRLLTGFALDEREVRHFVTYRPPLGFDSLSLSALPTSLAPAAAAAANFRWFLRLAQYTALKGELGLTGSDLIDVFESARHAYDPATPPATAEAALLTNVQSRAAQLLRRPPPVVEETAKALGFGAKADPATLLVEASDYAQEHGLRRLWDALRTVEKLGVSADAVRRWTQTIDPAETNRDLIAKDLRNALKARFSDEVWPAVVQPISDELRRRKRDALVAYVLADPKQDFQNPDELYEYFLVDPATEPVVQTSRIELAISSVQLFVQRCLLNLEPRVPAAVIDAEKWQWMKRYRLRDANCRIFLYPENWLEPEFRDDKTHLFRELERSVLQGEVSNDTAEDAFLTYLNGLEQIARLQMVSMYAEEHGETTTLHVIGRTFAVPHKYYYRRFADNVWSPWEPVAVEIEGDHVNAIVWHGRLHLFWLTFQERSEVVSEFSPPNSTPSLQDELKAVATGLAGDLMGRPTPANQQAKHTLRHKVEIRLNWSDYIDGAWTPPSAPPTTTLIEHDIPDTLNTSTFFTWVSKEQTTDGTEGALYVHVLGSDGLTARFSARFRIASKHSPPTVESTDELGEPLSPEWRWPPADWYSAQGYNATRRDPGGFGILYSLAIGPTVADATIVTGVPSAYELLLADNELTLGLTTGWPPAVFGPFFYQDERNTFFVRPAMILSYTFGLAMSPPVMTAAMPDPRPIEAAVPDLHIERLTAIHPLARFAIRTDSDWLTGSDNGIAFDNVVIRREGGDSIGNARR